MDSDRIKKATTSQLMDDLGFAKHYKMICELTVEYWDEGEWTFVQSKEEAQERVDGCKEIINNIVFELGQRNILMATQD